jgi:hypothetical protein
MTVRAQARFFLPGATAARESGIEDSREFAHYIE